MLGGWRTARPGGSRRGSSASARQKLCSCNSGSRSGVTAEAATSGSGQVGILFRVQL